MDRLVLRPVGGERAFFEPDRIDCHRAHGRVRRLDGFLNEFLPAGVFHPGEGDMWGKLVRIALKTQADQSVLDGGLELDEGRRPLFDPEPKDGDVIEGGKDAQSLEGGLERFHVGLGDRPVECVDDIVDTTGVGIAEKLHRDVGLFGVGEVKARRAPDGFLQVGDWFGERVRDIDADEQPHTGVSWAGGLNPPSHIPANMTQKDREERDGREDGHEFSSGQGFNEPYDGFDLDPPELDVGDPSAVDPVDSRAVTDLLDDRNIASGEVDADSLIDIGIEYMSINRDEQAVETFERAARYAENDTREAEAWVNKGIAHGELEEWDAAVSSHREALHVDEDGEFGALAHTNLAYALWEQGEDEAAFQHAEDAVRADQRLPQAWYNLGYIQVERAQYEDALECLDNAIRLGFQESAVYEEKARALEGLERDEEAAEMRETATEMQEAEEERLVQGE